MEEHEAIEMYGEGLLGVLSELRRRRRRERRRLGSSLRHCVGANRNCSYQNEYALKTIIAAPSVTWMIESHKLSIFEKSRLSGV